ncbi:MAG TPA: LysM peptidoglycan-binding domain-containing protein [Candidatus Acidoferrales bacterium]|nr:LysM peptidoglycan-binding domain-containing protein [Candidatus Acidoferrales bacterium]
MVPARPGVDVVIDEVEQQFEQGERDYRANQLPKARQEFDDAINLLLASGLNFSTDPRLEPLMNHVIDAQHEFEENAAQQGGATETAATEQEAQPAGPTTPFEEIATLPILPANPELSQKVANELLHVPHDLPITLNEYVLTFLNFFETTRGRKIIEHGLARSGRYAPMVRQVLRQEGLPLDLMYLPLPESGYQARARSRKGAVGLWQFIPGRAREYGLDINRWEDERMDPEKATRAAAEHLRDLYQTFHDWYLVLAAYDSGPLTVVRAIEKTGYADFWQLYRLNALPGETKNYVPIMLAMTLVAKEPALYGVNVTDPQEPILTDNFVPGRSIDLRLVADATGTDLETIRSLNPALVGVITPDIPTFTLHLTAGTAKTLRTTLASLPADRWVGWRLHRATAGETLDSVARQYHLRLAALAEANDLDPGDDLSPGQTLLVPAPMLSRTIYYRVRRGETLEDIASRFGVSSADLRRWNRLHSNRVRAGERLRISTQDVTPSLKRVSSRRRIPAETRGRPTKPAVDAAEARGHQVHVARMGETLWSIAQRFHITIRALDAANPAIARRGLKAGDSVVVPH